MSAPGLRACVLIPARDEAADLDRCLDAVLAQDVDPAGLEVIVVDGASRDGTATLAHRRLREAGLGRFAVLTNEQATTPSNLNLGLAVVASPIVCRVDARSVIPPHYVRRCIEVLDAQPEVRVVGGSQVAVPRDGSARSLGIARALNNRFTMGMARYRRGGQSGPTDTVYLGAFRTADLRAAGGWDEAFLTNQDYELNRRMGRDGVVWFADDLEVGYLPRRDVGDLVRQYVRFGSWKAQYWQTTGDRPSTRQVAALAIGPLGLLAALGLTRARWRSRVIAVGGGLVAVGVAEAMGARTPSAGPSGHLWALPAMAATSGGWLWGAWRGLATGRLRGASGTRQRGNGPS